MKEKVNLNKKSIWYELEIVKDRHNMNEEYPISIEESEGKSTDKKDNWKEWLEIVKLRAIWKQEDPVDRETREGRSKLDWND